MQQVSDPTSTEEPGLQEGLPLPGAGTVIDQRYRVVRLIGCGGMGAVYEAELTSVGRRCALKFLRRELAGRSRSAARFEREARLLGKLEHEHVTAVLDVGSYLGEVPFFVMEYLEGRTLKQLLAEDGPLPVATAVEILLQVARGMAYVHGQGIVHRDLKPENLMLLQRSDGRPWVKILDFGIARALREEEGGQITRSGVELGTAHYMSPEQARGAKVIGPSSDVYALGGIAYEALTGARVHSGDSYNAVIFHLLTQPHLPLAQLLPGCPASLAAIVERCLDKDAGARYADAGALADALSAEVLAPGMNASNSDVACSATSASNQWLTRGRTARWVALASILGTLGTAAALTRTGQSPQATERAMPELASPVPGSEVSLSRLVFDPGTSSAPAPFRMQTVDAGPPSVPEPQRAAEQNEQNQRVVSAKVSSASAPARRGSPSSAREQNEEGARAAAAASTLPPRASHAEGAFPFVTSNPYGDE